MIQQYLLLKVKKQSVKQPKKKSETCWRIIIIPAAGLQEQNLHFGANKHFYDRQLCIGTVAPGAAETHTGCRAIEPYCIYWLKIYNLLLKNLSKLLYRENILRSGLYVQSVTFAFVQTNIILICELFIYVSASLVLLQNWDVFPDAD